MKNVELELAAVEEGLSFIPADDRDLWVKIAMALKDEFGEDAKDAWMDWSATAKAFDANAAASVWKSVKPGKVTIASFVYEAKQFGWRPKRSAAKRITPEEYERKQREREKRRLDEEARERERNERAARRAAALWGEAEPAESHPYLTRKGIQPHGARIGQWSREWPDPETGELIQITVDGALLIPVYSGPGKIATIQAVFPARHARMDRDKDYLPGGAKQGGYYPLGKVSKSTTRLIVAEGFATGASVHEATNSPVLVAFDAGNLLQIAEHARKMLPDAEIIIAGDNDLWTMGNPGARKANAAAFAVGGKVALPIFADYEGNPTDFNDLRDPAEIRAQIDGAIGPVDPERFEPDTRLAAPPAPVEEPPEPDPAEEAPEPVPDGEVLDLGEQPEQPTDEDAYDDVDDDIDPSGYFRILGYDHDRYYVFQSESKQIAVLSVASFTDAGFIRLAPLNWWEMNFPGDKGFDKRLAINWFMRLAHSRGIYNPNNTRGRGAWMDKGRVVLHLGNELVVDGAETPITKIDSRYVYELRQSLPGLHHEAMDSDDGERIIEIARKFRWTRPASAAMISGWIALAPLCGALKWRPHVWVSGGAGTGKTTLLNDFVHRLCAGMDVYAQGNSTEAGIRQRLQMDALPVLFDESEQNNDREMQRVQAILALIRQSSSESDAQTLKGTTDGESRAFYIRSMFCLSSIQVGIKNQADSERLAILSLRPKRDTDHNAAEEWAKLKELLYSIKSDEDLPSRLVRRSLDLLPITLRNIDIFARAGAEKFGSQRDGDQYGTLMAGAWSLISTREATPEEAREMFDRYDWTEYMEHTETDEARQALNTIMGALLRLQGGATLTVHEVLTLSQGFIMDGVADIKPASAEALLGRYGIKIRGEELLFATSAAALGELVADTPFAADIKGQLLRVPGARRYPDPVWVSGATQRCVSVPLTPLLEGVKDLPKRSDDDRDDDRPF